MWAYEEGELVMSSLVSTGTAEVPETTTPVGYHSVLAKFDAQTMEGTISGELLPGRRRSLRYVLRQ